MCFTGIGIDFYYFYLQQIRYILFIFSFPRYARYYEKDGKLHRTLFKAYGIHFDVMVYGQVMNIMWLATKLHSIFSRNKCYLFTHVYQYLIKLHARASSSDRFVSHVLLWKEPDFPKVSSTTSFLFGTSLKLPAILCAYDNLLLVYTITY